MAGNKILDILQLFDIINNIFLLKFADSIHDKQQDSKKGRIGNVRDKKYF
jgi:hypothetical protein